MDAFVPYIIHNWQLQLATSAVLAFALGLVAGLPRRGYALPGVALAVAVALTFGFTSLSWALRVEYPGNYPFWIHVLSSGLPVCLGVLIGTVVVLAVRALRPAA